jgi:hypothetical protein
VSGTIIPTVIPARAGIRTVLEKTWIPACAGMTEFVYVE